MRGSKTIYVLTTDDVKTVADEELSRDLTAKELKYVIDNLPGYIDWYQAISNAITEAVHFPKTKTRRRRVKTGAA